MKNLVVTIPAYNEEKTIGHLVKDIKDALGKEKYNVKILVIDDGSKDRTRDIAKKSGSLVYSHPKNYGLAETFRTELEKCLELNADVIVHIDADGQYLPKEIPKLLRALEQGNDLVLGSRFKGKIEEMPLIKRVGNRAFSRVISRIAKIRITDAQTGFRVFTKEVAKLPLTSTHTYTQEQIIRATKNKFKIVEVPVYFAVRKSGKSRLISNPFEFAAKAWISIIRIYRDYEPLKFFGIIGSFLFLMGFIIGLWLLFLFLNTGRIGHIPSAILSMLLILVGIQIILFGFLADMIKK